MALLSLFFYGSGSFFGKNREIGKNEGRFVKLYI